MAATTRQACTYPAAASLVNTVFDDWTYLPVGKHAYVSHQTVVESYVLTM